MIKNIVICDRCKEECEGTTYYTIDIYGHDIKPSIGQSFTTVAQNANTNFSYFFNIKKHYCESCKKKVEEFLTGNYKISI